MSAYDLVVIGAGPGGYVTAVAMEFGASAEDLARTIHAHPSLSGVVKEACWAAQE